MASEVAEVLEALERLEQAYESYRGLRRRREYVRREHVPFLDSRMRTFEEYRAVGNVERFTHLTRLTPREFERLYARIAHKLHHSITHVSPISGRQRLFIYLRFVGHGIDFGVLAEEVHCGISTVSEIVYEVAEAIATELYEDAFPPITREYFEEIARKTQIRYGYPRAAGFMDGKHIRIKKPANSGSRYYNYKKFFSIILLAVVDCDYRILAYDLGAPGRVGDAGVFMNSKVKKLFETNDHLFPPTRNLGRAGAVQYHILVDSGFAQGYRYVRPYAQVAADTPSKRRFNAKHSGARRMVESTFGILCRRFGILQKTMDLHPVNAVKVVRSLLVLHNLIARRQDALAHARRFPAPNEELAPLEEAREGGEGRHAAELARERIRTYYDNLYGPVR